MTKNEALAGALAALVRAVEVDHAAQSIDPRNCMAAHSYIAIAMREADDVLAARAMRAATRRQGRFQAGRQSAIDDLADALANLKLSPAKRNLVMAAFRAAIVGMNARVHARQEGSTPADGALGRRDRSVHAEPLNPSETNHG